MLNAYGGIDEAGYVADADFDRDGQVDASDLGTVNLQWGQGTVSGQLSGAGSVVGYAGYLYDGELLPARYTVRHRTYSPDLGRWLQRNPLRYTFGMNMYEYVRSRPWSYVDPTGMAPDACSRGAMANMGHETKSMSELVADGIGDADSPSWGELVTGMENPSDRAATIANNALMDAYAVTSAAVVARAGVGNKDAGATVGGYFGGTSEGNAITGLTWSLNTPIGGAGGAVGTNFSSDGASPVGAAARGFGPVGITSDGNVVLDLTAGFGKGNTAKGSEGLKGVAELGVILEIDPGKILNPRSDRIDDLLAFPPDASGAGSGCGGCP